MVININTEKYFFVGLSLIIATLPFLLSHNLVFILTRISIVLVVLAWIPQKKFNFKAIARNRILISFLLYFLLILSSILYSSNLNAGISSTEKALPLLVFPLVILTIKPLSFEKIVILLRIFVITVTLASLICLGYAFHRNNYVDVFVSINWFYFSYYDLTEIINIQPIYLSLFVGFSILLLLSDLILLGSKQNLVRRSISVVWIAHLFIFLLLLAGKASIISMILILIFGSFLFFYQRENYWSAIIFASLIIIVSVGAIYKLPIVRERFIASLGLNKTSDWVYGDPNSLKPNLEARLIKWEASTKIIKDNWLFGVGAGDVQDELNMRYKEIGFQLGVDERFNAHNQYLQTSIGIGVVGLLVFLSTLLIGLKESIRTKNYLYLSFIAFFAMNCFTESLMERQYAIILYSLFSCLLFDLRRPTSPIKI
jgi:O-antigen ligase